MRAGHVASSVVRMRAKVYTATPTISRAKATRSVRSGSRPASLPPASTPSTPPAAKSSVSVQSNVPKRRLPISMCGPSQGFMQTMLKNWSSPDIAACSLWCSVAAGGTRPSVSSVSACRRPGEPGHELVVWLHWQTDRATQTAMRSCLTLLQPRAKIRSETAGLRQLDWRELTVDGSHHGQETLAAGAFSDALHTRQFVDDVRHRGGAGLERLVLHQAAAPTASGCVMTARCVMLAVPARLAPTEQ
jgi:hypothetical protein